MATTLTSDSGMAAMLSTYYDKLGLERLLAEVVLYNMADKKKLPKNEGKTVIFHRLYNFSQTVSAHKLTEGTAPTAGKLSSTPISATLEQYGNTIAVSDLLEMTAVSDVVEDAVAQLGEQAAQIVDKRIFETAYGTSSIPSGAGFPIVYDDGTLGALSTVTSTHTLDVASIRHAVSELKRKNVKPMEDGYFAYVTHTTAARFLEGDSAWQTAYQYTTPENLRKGEIGRIAGVKVYETTNTYSTVSGTGAHNTTAAYFSLMLGRGSIGVSQIEQSQFRIYKVPASAADHSNPLQQFSTLGWKATFVPVILNASCGVVHVTSGNS